MQITADAAQIQLVTESRTSSAGLNAHRRSPLQRLALLTLSAQQPCLPADVLLQYGVAENVFANPSFWFVCLLANLTTFGHRYIERAAVWLFKPNDDMILVEIEAEEVRSFTDKL